MSTKRYTLQKSLESIEDTESTSQCLSEDNISNFSAKVSNDSFDFSLSSIFHRKLKQVQIDKICLFHVLSCLSDHKLECISARRNKLKSISVSSNRKTVSKLISINSDD